MTLIAGDTTPSSRRHLLEALAGGIVLVVAWIVVAANEAIPGPEETIFRAVNGLPDWVEYVGWPVMQFGSALAIPVLGVLVWRASRNRRLAVEVMLAGAIAWVVARAIKEIAGRERPGGVLADIELRPLWEGLGFPSGHAAIATAIATVVSVWATGRWLVALWTIPLLVGLMRIYTGAHFPLDVVAGWGLGLLIGSAVAWVGRHYASSSTTEPQETGA